MCANFKPLTLLQLQQLQLPQIDFSVASEVYPQQPTPLLFHSAQGLQWREVNFGLIPKWATEKRIASKTYNARQETLLQKASFAEAAMKAKFGVIAVDEFYETKYINAQPQRWGVRRRDGQAFYIAALYEICKINNEIIRSASMLTMDAIDHPMMKEFHAPGSIKRSVIVIPQQRLIQWLTHTSANIQDFVQGFPVTEFECSHVPKIKASIDSPQLNLLDE